MVFSSIFFDCPPVRYPSPCCVMTSVMKPFSVLKLYRMVFASYDVPLSSNMGLPMISPIESGVPTAYTVVESISISISLASSLMLPYTIFPSPYMYALFLPVSTIESLAEKSTVLSRSTFVRTIFVVSLLPADMRVRLRRGRRVESEVIAE